MRTVPFQSILNWLARRMLGSEANLTAEFASAYVDMINTAVRECWERDFWPEWTVTEQRQYRDTWTAGTKATGTEVFYAGTYWRATATTSATPAAGATGWEQCGVNGAAIIDAVLSLEQAGQTPIGTPRGIARQDPREFLGTGAVPFTLSPRGVEVSASALTLPQPWLTYRQRPPVFTSAVWVSSATAGQRFYDAASGECYLALADNTLAPAAGATQPGAETLTVTGTLTPDVTGSYAVVGLDSHGFKIYGRQTAAGLVLIYREAGVDPPAWYINPFDASNLWQNAAGPAGSYEPANDADGTATAILTTPTVPAWQLIEFPYVLAEAVKRFAYADALRDDGQNDKASMEEDFAEDALSTEWTKAESQCGIVRKFDVRTC